MVKEGVVTAEKVKEIYDSYEKICNEAHELALKETHIQVMIPYSY